MLLKNVNKERLIEGYYSDLKVVEEEINEFNKLYDTTVEYNAKNLKRLEDKANMIRHIISNLE